MQAERLEVIIITGVEGGGISLYGERKDTGWRFRRSRVDQTALMLNESAANDVVERNSGWIDSWEEALQELDRAGWMGLPAVRVHPEFRAVVWRAVQERIGSGALDARGQKSLLRWKERCHPASQQ